jgi:hypothetical protein
MENIKIEDPNYYIDWLENPHINHYEYSDFKNLEKVGIGSFARVYRANRKNIDTIYALKTFRNQESLKEVVNEVQEPLISYFILKY